GPELAGVLGAELAEPRVVGTAGVQEGLRREIQAGERAGDGGDAETGDEAEADHAVLAGDPGEAGFGDGFGVLDLAAGFVDREGAAEAEQRLAGEAELLALLRGARKAALDEEQVD